MGSSFASSDDQSPEALAHNSVLHARTKHMELGILFVRERSPWQEIHGALQTWSRKDSRSTNQAFAF